MKSKQLIFLGLVLLSQINSFAGLAPNTLVYTPDGLVVLQDLIVSNLVVSQHDSSLITNSILQVKQAIHDQYLKISLTQGDLRVSLNQVFYVPKLNQWIPASSLVSGDYLLSMSGGLIKIQEIKLVQEPFKALNLTVANDHNFYISQDLILVHNEPVTFALVGGALVAQKALEFAVAYGAKAFLAGLIGYGIYSSKEFNKKSVKIKKPQKVQIFTHAAVAQPAKPAQPAQPAKPAEPAVSSPVKVQPEEAKEKVDQEIAKPVGYDKTEEQESELTPEDVAKRLKEILKDAQDGRETKGRSEQFEKPNGDYDEAVEDFKSLKPTGVRDIKDGKTGILADGREINVRKGSTDTRPTLEIINGKKRIKIRYGNK